MRRNSLRWATALEIVTTEEEVRRLDAPRFDRLAGYAHPDARGLGARLVSDWMFWFFPFDDWFDGPLGEDPAAVRDVVCPMIRFVHGEWAALPASAPPLLRAFADLCGRSRMGMSATWQNRFAEDTAKYLYSYILEAIIRRSGQEPDMEHVVEVRRDAIGIRPSLAFGETAEQHEVAFPLVLSETVHELRKVCADIVVVQNDAYSLSKDLRQGESSNQAVALIRRHGMTAPEAIEHLERSHDRLIETFLRLEATSTALPPRYGLPEQAPHLAHYLSTLRCWISGNDAWSRETQRYARA
ncbi:terpene synthase family protein [Streptomyces sp. NBC_00467]|uniref:terpene synthase family protein n=1 Tax=Streptomyces sp. NBC_00467 TaxID=2975752 RepID=UPI002E195615